MVYRSRPITKFCCSDTPEREVRIVAIFSIISTCFCLFLIFLSFANLVGQRESYARGLRRASILNSTVCHNNESNLAEISNNEGTPVPDLESNSNCTTKELMTIQFTTPPTTKSTTIKSKKKSKEPSQSTLDWICRLLLWERNVETFWILLPCFWNVCDVLRGLLLLHASTTKQPCLLKTWYALTSANVLAGIIIFYPIFTNYTAGDLVATFIVIYILLIFYNCYSLWIVSVLLKEISIGGRRSAQAGRWTSGHAQEDPDETDHIQRF